MSCRPELRAKDPLHCLDEARWKRPLGARLQALLSELEGCAAAALHGAFASSGPVVFFTIEQALDSQCWE